MNKNILSYYRELIDENETDKYFEFKRQYEERPIDILYERAHKCSYLEVFKGEESPEEGAKIKIVKFNDSACWGVSKAMPLSDHDLFSK